MTNIFRTFVEIMRRINRNTGPYYKPPPEGKYIKKYLFYLFIDRFRLIAVIFCNNNILNFRFHYYLWIKNVNNKLILF